MRILWMSDSPTSPSGFGNVTRHVCGGLARLGHEIDIVGWQASGGAERWEGCTVHPVRRSAFGADVLLDYLQKLRPDVLVTLADVWWLTFIESPFISAFRRTAGIPWALYFPIDGDRGGGALPPSWVRILHEVDLPIAMSRYGAAVAQANGVAVDMIPHGVDLEVFHPPADREAAKRSMGYEGRFVILSDARNQPRKMLPRTLDIVRRFARGRPDVLLHLHCDPDDPAARSAEYNYDLRADIAMLGLRGTVRLTEGMDLARGGLPLSRLADIYRAADVHLLASLGEGFGLPTLQAAAAGVVPLAGDATASAELVAGHGEPLPIADEITDRFGLQRSLIDLDAAVAALERLHADPALRAHKAAAGVRFARDYDWGAVVGEWDAVLRRGVPRARGRLDRPAAAATRLSLSDLPAPDGGPDPLDPVRSALPDLLGAVRVDVRVVSRQAGDLTLAVQRDAAASRHHLTLPATMASADPALAPQRVTGCVHLAGPRDAPVARALAAVFPGLNAWSTAAFTLGPSAVDGKPVVVKVVQAGGEDYDRHLAASTLALDLGGADAALPARAAALGVPCLGVAGRHPDQDVLWPGLTLPGDDEAAAVALARQMLVDEGRASRACAQARQTAREGAPALV